MTNATHEALKALLSQLPTLAQGQADDLKLETPQFRLWLSRMTTEDGATEDNAVTIEYYVDGQWLNVEDNTVKGSF